MKSVFDVILIDPDRPGNLFDCKSFQPKRNNGNICLFRLIYNLLAILIEANSQELNEPSRHQGRSIRDGVKKICPATDWDRRFVDNDIN